MVDGGARVQLLTYLQRVGGGRRRHHCGGVAERVGGRASNRAPGSDSCIVGEN